MFSDRSYAREFMAKKQKDNFFNLKRAEDASTIFHGELIGHSDAGVDYWCEPPHGFAGDCDIILVVFGLKASIILAVNKVDGVDTYTVTIKNPKNFPKVLRDGGFNPNVPYPEMDVADIIRLVN